MNARIPRARALTALLLTTFVAAACDDSNNPTFPTTPVVLPDVASLDFGTLDSNFGPGQSFSASIMNMGSSAVMVGPLTIAGTHAADVGLVQRDVEADHFLWIPARLPLHGAPDPLDLAGELVVRVGIQPQADR